jgi:hypothetical protein
MTGDKIFLQGNTLLRSVKTTLGFPLRQINIDALYTPVANMLSGDRCATVTYNEPDQ